MKKVLINIFFSSLIITSCYYDVEEEIYPMTGCMTEEMSYSMDILPIVFDNCYACHDAASNFGGITLEGYQNFLARVTSGQLLGAIKHEPGFSPMPNNAPKLLDCEIEKIEAWIIQGAMDN